MAALAGFAGLFAWIFILALPLLVYFAVLLLGVRKRSDLTKTHWVDTRPIRPKSLTPLDLHQASDKSDEQEKSA
jgi:hypothetical protein